MARTPNEIGEALEVRARRALNGERIRQSGGGKFFKSDVRDKLRMLWECKATDRHFFRITKELILKARAAARGQRGAGDGYRWGIITEVEGTAVVIVELDTWVEVVTGDPAEVRYIEPDKAAVRRASARRSLLG